MIFNSLEFAIFLPLVFALYWGIGSQHRNQQNLLVLIASYVFYGWWNWTLLTLIIFSSALDFFIGLWLSKETNRPRRKFALLLSLISNLGLLFYFKYSNFFIQSFLNSFTLFGLNFESQHINVILPVGISFYTLQTLSYTLDVYKKKINPTTDFVSFFAFVSFFPQLVAGPIERASHLLPQFKTQRVFNYDLAVDGCRQILYGLFKKVVIADKLAGLIDPHFADFQDAGTLNLLSGALFFSVQIYADFSGYSDIAIGTAKLFGFSLSTNFRFPYFSQNISEFWKRWHITLSTWFRDYVYIPLGGNRKGLFFQFLGIFMVFILSSLWHGANSTFLAWGLLHFCFYVGYRLSKPLLSKLDFKIQNFPIMKGLALFFSMGLTFFAVTLAWIFFRSDSIEIALNYFTLLLTDFSFSYYFGPKPLLLIGCFFLWEYLMRNKTHGFELSFLHFPVLRKIVYFIAILGILSFWGSESPFIYFQF